MPELVELPINDIICLESNPRSISDQELEKLCDDISNDTNFLLQRPPLINHIDGKYYCYAGNQRVKACRKLKFKSIFCFVENNVPEKLQDERMLKDNLHRGEWNKEMLFDLGFEMDELQDFGFDDFTLGFEDLEYPDEFTAPKKDNPPTVKITFKDSKQLERFTQGLPIWLEENHFDGVTYSVSEGEI